MKKAIRAIRITIIVLSVILLLYCLHFMFCKIFLNGMFLPPPTKEQIIRYVKANENKLLSVVESDKNLKGVIVNEVNRDYGVIDFDCGGKGLGSETYYCGFYYSFDDEPSSVWFGQDLTETDAGWEYREVDGDNYYYTERIIGNWFFYEMEF